MKPPALTSSHDFESLVSGAAQYCPSAKVVERLNKVALISLIGPVAVGKSACMNQIIKRDTSFGRVQSFTTRPKRSEEADSEYRFLPHDETTIKRIAAAANRGDLVQYAVHPTTGYIYGSDSTDYGRPYMMLDALASSVPSIRRLPFGKIIEISVVAEPQQWERRFNTRNADPTEARRRLLEGRASLQWSLNQGESMIWICNSEGKLTEASEEIHGIADGTREPNTNNRVIGQQLLDLLEDLT